tara:strand:+ start:1493 stop:1879 length:387 start_codon:yes stop_codon:yes gene_type:complete
MASKKLKKAIVAGLAGVAGAKFLAGKARAASIADNEAKEFGFSNMKKNYITKKAKNSFKDKVKKAIGVYATKGLNTGRGPGIKPTDSLAGDYGDAFSDADGMPKGARAGKMIKARGGKLVSLKPTKLY